MKNVKKKPTPNRATVALSPRRRSLRRLGVIAAGLVGLALIVLASAYGNVLWSGRGWFGPAVVEEEDPFDPATPNLNARTPPGPAPDGMVWIPGGEFWMGGPRDSLDPDDKQPICDGSAGFGTECYPMHKVTVHGFWMDLYEVTNEQFAEFVAATQYVTVAEQVPTAKEFPDADPEQLKPFSLVPRKLTAGDDFDLHTHKGLFEVCYGACWKHPEGPRSDLRGRAKHPVVHVCWHDAVAFCQWSSKRLPTEAEWEFAGRGGLDRKKYPWGDELKPNGKCMANYWQGEFPVVNTKEDGFEGTAPVGSFPPNGYGLYDMAGNVWEWCADYYHHGYYWESDKHNPKGPFLDLDPVEPQYRKRVQRGGSFLCAENYCQRFVVGTRGKGEARSSWSHLGFRCVMDAH